MWYSSTTSVVSCLPFQKPIIQICAILSAFEYHKFWEPSPQICFFEDIDFLFEDLTVDLVRKFLHRCFRDWRDSWLLWLTVVRRLLILISVETALLRYTHLLCFSYLFSDHTWCAFSFFFGFRFQFFIINLKSGWKTHLSRALLFLTWNLHQVRHFQRKIQKLSRFAYTFHGFSGDLCCKIF